MEGLPIDSFNEGIVVGEAAYLVWRRISASLPDLAAICKFARGVFLAPNLKFPIPILPVASIANKGILSFKKV